MSKYKLNVIVETPKGGSVKYDYNPKLGRIELNKAMPVGLVFPFDFGFIPGTTGEDEDPLDVIVLSEFASFPGCGIECRIVGCMQAEQTEKDGKKIRNDRFLAIPLVSVVYGKIKSIDGIPKNIIEQLGKFFENYNQQAGKTFKILDWVSAKEARRTIEKAHSKLSQPQKLIQVLIPLYDKKKNLFPQKHYADLQQQLTQKFGGVTVYNNAPLLGIWKNDVVSNIEKDKLIIFEIMADRIDAEYWKSLRKMLEKRFRQDQIIIRQTAIGLL